MMDSFETPNNKSENLHNAYKVGIIFLISNHVTAIFLPILDKYCSSNCNLTKNEATVQY